MYRPSCPLRGAMLVHLHVVAFVSLFALSLDARAQVRDDGTIDLSARRWCADSGTACWTSPDARGYFNGVRIVAEFDVSYLFHMGRSRFENDLQALPKLAVETNLLDGWVALQLGLFAPKSVVLDERSTEAIGSLVAPATRTIQYDYGLSLGLSFLDGSVAFGVGRLIYDSRAFRADSLRASPGLTRDTFVFAALQPVSSLRASLKDDGADD